MTRHPAVRPAVTVTDLVKVYGAGETEVRALDGVSLTFGAGRFTAIMGPSGSGKSTLMHCAAGLDPATAGGVRLYDVDGSRGGTGGYTDLTTLRDKQLTLLRRERIGFIFQSFNLLPTLTAAQNIMLPLDLAGRRPDAGWYRTIVDVLGLADRLDHRPAQLSGGQQQRVACARALLSRPDVVFADEPTGNLDSATGREVLEFLRRSVAELGQTVVMVTHDPVAAAYADRVVLLADGRLAGDLTAPTADAILDEVRRLDAAGTRGSFAAMPGRGV
jgi:putative ABC transport system ATP-binding protein